MAKHEFTDAELKQLAETLLGTRLHIFRTAEKLFNMARLEEEDWERMTKLTGVFKCEICGWWRGADMKDPDMAGELCAECVNNMCN